jgi:Na+-translocating ferredoxin:NAD+ oxidoreductase RnfD subunit
MVCSSFWADYYMLIYTHCWELMNSVGSHDSLSLLFVMKVMVCHFVSDSHEVMTALIVMLPLIVVVEISLQLHQAIHTTESVEVLTLTGSLLMEAGNAIDWRCPCSTLKSYC